ncbi:hypothetical protein COC69_05145 [Bacillus cereus]|uniref:Uncharacterized protein n=1 Tax=Bacillus cereus TaxID=1396 RepID=A0A9X7CR21_BACCE|nr:hypothetical protein [Bacillus cereus]PGS81997.1 hypothetical protein COC69_05145 [Bacillus cereus]
MLKKFLSIAVIISMLTFIMIPTGAFAAGNGSSKELQFPQENMKLDIKIDKDKLAIVTKTSEQANKYISIQNNRYSVDHELKNVIGLEAYNIYVDGATKLNLELNKGLYHFENNRLVQNDIVSNYMSADAKWWGVSVYLSDNESRDLVSALSAGAMGSAVILGIAAVVEAVSLGTATPILIVLGAMAGFYASEVSNRNKRNGVRLDYNWFDKSLMVRSR